MTRRSRRSEQASDGAATEGHRQRLRERLRAEFIADAEEDSRRRLVSGLTAGELERVLPHYPADRIPRCGRPELRARVEDPIPGQRILWKEPAFGLPPIAEMEDVHDPCLGLRDLMQVS